MEVKQCSKCKLEKGASEFYSRWEGGLRSECKSCFSARAKEKYKNPEYQESVSVRHYKAHRTAQGYLNSLRTGAKYRHIPFSLSTKQFKPWFDNPENHVCIYCKRPVVVGAGFRNINTFSVDRKDNSKGYTIDNIVACCVFCNNAKGKFLSYEQMILLGQAVRQVILGGQDEKIA